MGVARTVGAIRFSVVIALLWHLFSVRKRKAKQRGTDDYCSTAGKTPDVANLVSLFTLVLILVFVNWGAPFALDKGLWTFIFTYKWYITGSSCSDALLVACPNIEIASIMGMCSES